MKELLRTNNPVRLSWLQALLSDSGIDSLVLDHHTSLVEGNIGAIPRRLMVADRDLVARPSIARRKPARKPGERRAGRCRPGL